MVTLRAMTVEKLESMLKTWMKDANPIINCFISSINEKGLLSEIDLYIQNCNFTKQSLRENSIDSVATSTHRSSPTK
jgi:hypothetical protein